MIEDARIAFCAGDLPAARESLAELSKAGNRFSDVAALDLAIVELAAGDNRAAEQRLRKLRDHYDQTGSIALLNEAASLVTDDTTRRFRPAPYEEVMIRTMLAVCSLAGDAVDAESYTLQATMKQTEFARHARQRGVPEVSSAYQPIAFAPYLRGVLREATHHDYDDAAKAYRLVSDVRPQFAPAAADIARASEGVHSAPGNGVLYVIACVGRGPVLAESKAEITSAALSIASSVLNAQTNRAPGSNPDIVLPNIAAVKVPRVVIPPPDVAAVGIRINGDFYGATQTLTDIGQLASDQVAAEMPWTIARAVVRRATKEAAVAKTTSALGLQGTAGSLFHFAAASSWSGIEHADTRCWGLLPREIQVFRAEMPAGDYQVGVVPIGVATGPAGGTERTVTIANGQNRYLVVVCPGPTTFLVAGENQ